MAMLDNCMKDPAFDIGHKAVHLNTSAYVHDKSHRRRVRRGLFCWLRLPWLFSLAELRSNQQDNLALTKSQTWSSHSANVVEKR